MNTADAREGSFNGVFTISRTGYVNQAVSLGYSIGGAATPGDDYTGLTGSINFAAYQTTGQLTVVPVNDGVAETSESITVTLTAGSGYTVGTPGQATIILFDNELPVVMVEHVNDAVEGGTDGKFTLTRLGDLVPEITVGYSMSGTATSGTDYTSLSGSVTIPTGVGAGYVFIEAIHDGLADGGETAILTLNSGTGYTIDSQNGAGTVGIIEADPLPVAFDGWVTTSINEPIEVDAVDYATDLTPDELTVTAVTQGGDGSVVINQDGSVTYTPDTDFVGDDSFTYTVEDPFGNEATGTIEVTVTEPIAPPTSVWTALNTGVNIDVLKMAFDPDGDTLTTSAVTQGANGSVVINQDGSLTYTPNTSFTGDDSFTYTVEDPDENEATHTITVTVGPIDPVALDDVATTPVNAAVDVEVLDLAYDPEEETVELTGVTQGTNGTVTINLDGSVTYTPNNNFEGTDSFTYTVEDEDENPSTGTIEVSVGAEPESEADEIVDDLAELEAELENYDVNDPPDLVTAASAISTAIDDYVNGVTSFISANNIDLGGPQSVAIGIYLQMLLKMSALQTQHDGLHAMLLASKARCEDLADKVRIAKNANPPDLAVIVSLFNQLKGAIDAHGHAATAMVNTRKAMLAAYREAQSEYASLLLAYGRSPAVQNLNPPVMPTFQPMSIYTPK